MKNLKAVFFTLIISAIIPFYAEAASDTKPAAGVEFNIRFFDRRIYYVASDPIYIQATITNNSSSTYRFKLADERVFSLDFDVRTVTNRSLDPSDTLVRKRTQNMQVFFREITVEPGESFSFVEDLRDYVRLNEPGSFVVRACMYPELFRHDALGRTASVSVSHTPRIVESQRLTLSIRPPVITGPDGIPLEMDIATGAVLVRERLAPDQVVEYMITARQKAQWEKFFLYLDLEAMLLSQNAESRRKWNNESEEGRRRMIEQYRQELQGSQIAESISVVPTEFTVERTEYSSLEGSVTVLQKFKNSYFTEVKRYTYTLQLRDNIWTIVDYSVNNLGNE